MVVWLDEGMTGGGGSGIGSVEVWAVDDDEVFVWVADDVVPESSSA